MTISCLCGNSDYSWYYTTPKEYIVMEKFPRRKGCCSCRSLINAGDLCSELCRYSEDDDGNETNLASHWLCEECTDIFFSFIEYGYCVEFPANFKDDLETHKELEDYKKQESNRAILAKNLAEIPELPEHAGHNQPKSEG